MKGITMCAECAYYNMETHKCSQGAIIDPNIDKGDDPRFFVDCPFPDIELPVNKTAEWIDYGINGSVICSNPKCRFIDFAGRRDRVMLFHYCPGCGARMDGDNQCGKRSQAQT